MDRETGHETSSFLPFNQQCKSPEMVETLEPILPEKILLLMHIMNPEAFLYILTLHKLTHCAIMNWTTIMNLSDWVLQVPESRAKYLPQDNPFQKRIVLMPLIPNHGTRVTIARRFKVENYSTLVLVKKDTVVSGITHDLYFVSPDYTDVSRIKQTSGPGNHMCLMQDLEATIMKIKIINAGYQVHDQMRIHVKVVWRRRNWQKDGRA